MARDLYMLGLIVKDMGRSLAFYRRLGLAIPEGGEEKTHVEIKMGTGLTFFLDSRPERWDPRYRAGDTPIVSDTMPDYRAILEFYLISQAAVQSAYTELTGYGYAGRRSPYETSFGMCFAMVDDPDGNTILLSGQLDGAPGT